MQLKGCVLYMPRARCMAYRRCRLPLMEMMEHCYKTPRKGGCALSVRATTAEHRHIKQDQQYPAAPRCQESSKNAEQATNCPQLSG